ncbi:MAG: hypothetical protein JW986_06975 [Methanotrichaceae archaeon]|nr:hypothetical protein [Methanotrichaceae archaeon]
MIAWNAGWKLSLRQEIRRKSIHLTGLSVPAGIVLFGEAATAALIALALVVALILEALRLRGRIRLPEVRAREKDRVAGYFYYILGSLVTVIAFPATVAICAMLMLSLGDAASGLLGSVLRGSDVRGGGPWRIKPFPIVAGMFLACFAIGALSSRYTMIPWPIYAAGAAGATIADSVPLFLGRLPIDDNLTIPIYAGTAMALAAMVI